ncbi:hypothetical protein [Aurantimonas sp. HBX-1]|nr:hypothetical protein [Aurantimonas sp. HBX-1]UIJ71928.1 hypothetical protein LXB15_19975 [Aurantimonas sp. HBX-1]
MTSLHDIADRKLRPARCRALMEESLIEDCVAAEPAPFGAGWSASLD